MKRRGRFLGLAPQRRWIADLAYFSRRIPTVGIKRTLDVNTRIVDELRAMLGTPIEAATEA